MSDSLAIMILGAPWLALLCYYDARYRRLPNVLTLGGALVALAARFGYGYAPFLVEGASGGIVCGLFLLLPFLLGAAGGGDVKMIFAVGCMVGLSRVFDTLVFMSVCGFFLALFMLAFGAVDARRLKHYLRCVFDWRYDRAEGKKNLPPSDSEKSRVPFGIAIAMGMCCALIFEAFGERGAL